MIKKNKVVYLHRKKTDGTIFYVGMGNPDRPYQKKDKARSIVWHRVVKKYGYYIEVIVKNLTKQEAFDIEVDLIKKFGRKDKSLGNLVNLTDGGEGGGGDWNRETCYNIDTGKVYNSIKEAAIDLKIPYTTITSQLNGQSSLKENNPIRTLNNAYPEDALPKNTVYLEELIDFDTAYTDNLHNLDDEETDLLKVFDSLDSNSHKFIEMSYDMSTRNIGKALGINYCYVHRQTHKALKTLLKKDYHLYNNKNLKHFKYTTLSLPFHDSQANEKPRI